MPGVIWLSCVSLSHDVGTINASAEGVNIHTALQLTRDDFGRLKISNVSCNAAISKMRAKFDGTLGWVLVSSTHCLHDYYFILSQLSPNHLLASTCHVLYMEALTLYIVDICFCE